MYTIGEFSKISHVSARMLRYYEKLGLIIPASTGWENGYRYYDASQLKTILTIQEFQSYGVKLKEIKNVIAMTEEEQKQFFSKLYLELLEEQKLINSKVISLNEKLNKPEVNRMDNYHVILLNNDQQCVYGIRRKININAREIQQLFEDLYKELKEKNISRTGVSQLLYLSEEFSHENMEVEAQVQVSRNTPGAHLIPMCKCASVLHKGSHDELHKAYEAISKWMAENPQYHLAGPVIERFIKDDHDNKEFETGILFPVVEH